MLCSMRTTNGLLQREQKHWGQELRICWNQRPLPVVTLLLQTVMGTLTITTQQLSKQGPGRKCHGGREGYSTGGDEYCRSAQMSSVVSPPGSWREGSRLDKILLLRPSAHHWHALHSFWWSAMVPAHKGQSYSTPQARGPHTGKRGVNFQSGCGDVLFMI